MSNPPLHPSPDRSEWAKFIASFEYAGQGLWYTFRTQRNMRVHLIIALLTLLAGALFRISALEFALIFMMIGAVFAAEMINTAVECCVDLISPGYHDLAKKAKDVAAGAVLISAIVAVLVGICIFLPRITALLFG